MSFFVFHVLASLRWGCLWPSVRGLRQTRRQPLRSDLTHIPVVSDCVYASLPQSMGRNAGVSPGHLLRPALCMSVNGAECRGFPRTYTTAGSLYVSQWGGMQGFPRTFTTAGSLYVSQWGGMQGFPQDIYYGRLSVCQSMGRNAGVSPGHLLRPALCMSVNGA